MIYRFVKLSIQEEHCQTFIDIVKKVQPLILRFGGCTFLQLVQDLDQPSKFMTFSHWDSEADLDSYRNSELFIGFWKQVKPLFSEKAEAWSSSVIIDNL
jgi:autoinducer 2-degrading protein